MEPALREVEEQIAAFQTRLAAQTAHLEELRAREACLQQEAATLRVALRAPRLETLRLQEHVARAYVQQYYCSARRERPARKQPPRDASWGDVRLEADVSLPQCVLPSLQNAAEFWNGTADALRAERHNCKERLQQLRDFETKVKAAREAFGSVRRRAEEDCRAVDAEIQTQERLAEQLESEKENAKERLEAIVERVSNSEARVKLAEEDLKRLESA
eukprot:scaffold1311_cov256-Pinguiococcus_pyrenoidosus.AAC.34